jgi:hypothetical protein
MKGTLGAILLLLAVTVSTSGEFTVVANERLVVGPPLLVKWTSE